MAMIIESGDRYEIHSDALKFHESLPPKVYNVNVTPTGQYFLKCIETYSLPSKLYGETIEYTDRIINTFNSRSISTGVHFTGLKGSGKTLLAKNISINLMKENIPTIVVNTPFCDEAFKEFIHLIPGSCVIIFDEFDKVYELDQQEQMLTLFDGVYSSKKLFVLTSNNSYNINPCFFNRPGRIYYNISFDGLSETFIQEYCEDKLENKDHIEGVLNGVSIFKDFNFDMLSSVIEEMNRYKENFFDAVKLMNISLENDINEDIFAFHFEYKGKSVELERMNFNFHEFEIYTLYSYKIDLILEKIQELDEKTLTDLEMFDKKSFDRYDPKTKTFIYTRRVDGETYQLKIGRVPNQKRTFADYFMR